MRLFRVEKRHSPLFFHGIFCFLWYVTDFVPGRLGIVMRSHIGRHRFKHLGASAHILRHNTFFDGRDTVIGDNFYTGMFNYFAGGPIRIGNNVAIANYVIIETTNHIFDDPNQLIHEQGVERKMVVIEDNVWLADRATVLGGVTIGTGSVIGAGSVVTRDIPPNSIAVGNPARIIRKRT